MEEVFFPPEGNKGNPEQPSKAPKKAPKRVFRPRALIPNYPDYDSSSLVGEEAEDEIMTVGPKEKKRDRGSNLIVFVSLVTFSLIHFCWFDVSMQNY